MVDMVKLEEDERQAASARNQDTMRGLPLDIEDATGPHHAQLMHTPTGGRWKAFCLNSARNKSTAWRDNEQRGCRQTPAGPIRPES